MSVETVYPRIVAMCEEITPAYTTVFANIPRTIQDAELPAIVVFPGRATYDRSTLGENIVLEARDYRVIQFICRAEFGTEGQVQEAVLPYFARVRDHFMARPGLELDGVPLGVRDAYPTGDDGFQVGPYPLSGGNAAPLYAQIITTLRVEEVSQRNVR